MRKKLNQIVRLESYAKGALWSVIITYTGYVVRGEISIASDRT